MMASQLEIEYNKRPKPGDPDCCDACGGRGTKVEMGCFGPKRFDRCLRCRGTGRLDELHVKLKMAQQEHVRLQAESLKQPLAADNQVTLLRRVPMTIMGEAGYDMVAVPGKYIVTSADADGKSFVIVKVSDE